MIIYIIFVLILFCSSFLTASMDLIMGGIKNRGNEGFNGIVRTLGGWWGEIWGRF
jgi:hypothetical protein